MKPNPRPKNIRKHDAMTTNNWLLKLTLATLSAVTASPNAIVADDGQETRCEIVFESTLAKDRKLDTPFFVRLFSDGKLFDGRREREHSEESLKGLILFAKKHFGDGKTIQLRLSVVDKTVTAKQLEQAILVISKSAPEGSRLAVYVRFPKED